jgi:lysophospholipase L1-like esterase
VRTAKLLLALTGILVTGCGQSPRERPVAPTTKPTAGNLRFLALGDSYTVGESVDPARRWPEQLAGMLRQSGMDIDVPAMIATTGWTTDGLSRGMDRANPQGPYDLVTLLIGVNNQYRGRDLEQYRHEFAALLRRAIDLAGGNASRVVVLSIPDWGVTPFAQGRDRAKIGAEIDRFNAVNCEETELAGARYVDVTPVSREAAGRPDLVAPDGLHPSGEMYAEWAKLTLPAARAALARSDPASLPAN